MRSLQNELPPVVHLSVAFFVGAIVSLIVTHFSIIHVDGKVSAGQLIQYLITFLSAVFVTLCFRRLLETETREKDLVFAQLDQMLILVDEFAQLGNEQELSSVNSAIKSLNMKSNFLNAIGVRYNFSDSVKDTLDFKEKIRVLKNLSTQTPRRTEIEAIPILMSVKENVVNWTDELRTDIDIQIESLKRDIFDAQMAVNRA